MNMIETLKNEKIDPHVVVVLLEAMDLAQQIKGEDKHITAAELIHALIIYSLDRYGYLAKTVLNHLGIHTTQDVGKIIYTLIKHDIFKKEHRETEEEFNNIINLEEQLNYDETLKILPI